mmetsp:Transcript_9639/g.9308  ORF Transcript_9639/g.9308 Transcript_9639/m.9308 type:complete len:260 (+) Transcript_9639:254-1033(+)
MRIVDKAVFKTGLNSSLSGDNTDKLFIPIRRHRDIVVEHFHQMYSHYQQKLCPGGQLCLEGVYTEEVGDYLISHPFLCPLGSYCLIGSDKVIGTGLCPIGYFCSQETTYPVQAEAGSFTGSQGATTASKCPPGTFSSGSQSSVCSPCPDGYECKEKGTSKPNICKAGNYRAITESAICTSCPKGTFSFERGIRDALECIECPAGRICSSEGSTNISTSIPCTDGKVCPSGTGAESQENCPEGYYCPPETTTISARQFLC